MMWPWILAACWAYPKYGGVLPNGDRVPCPAGMKGCVVGAVDLGEPESVCKGFGHRTCEGGTMPLNPFGSAFLFAGFKWTVAPMP